MPVFYDSMIAKLVAWGGSRGEAIARMARALEEYEVLGIRTTIPFFLWLMREPDYLAGRVRHDLSRSAAGGAPRRVVQRFTERTRTRQIAHRRRRSTPGSARSARAGAGHAGGGAERRADGRLRRRAGRGCELRG